jgi:hypothetical protein
MVVLRWPFRPRLEASTSVRWGTPLVDLPRGAATCALNRIAGELGLTLAGYDRP